MTGPVLVDETDGAETTKLGAIVSTLKMGEGPAAKVTLPRSSTAVFDVRDKPMVPLPLKLETETVLCCVPLPDTLTTPSAVPVLFKMTFAAVKEIDGNFV